LLELLERERLVIYGRAPIRVLPLTAGTMYPSSITKSKSPSEGGFTSRRVCEKSEEQGDLLKAITPVMEQAGLRKTH